MACIMEPKMDSNGQRLAWDPATIPSTKPFVHICTTPYEPLTSLEDMNFIKARSSIYSSFHKNVRLINFEIGYSKTSKWFESLKDKWAEYTNFYIGGFLEAIYLSDEKDSETTTAQINAKIIDYDTKSRQQSTSTYNSQSMSSKSINNAFTKKRTQSSTNSPTKPITTPKHKVTTNSAIVIDDTENDDQPDDLQTNSVITGNTLENESNVLNQKKIDDAEFNELFSYYQKMKSQRSQQQTQSSQPFELITDDNVESFNSISGLAINKHTSRPKKRHLSELCNDDKSDDQSDDDQGDDQNIDQQKPNDKPKRTYNRRSSANKKQDNSVKPIKQKRTYNRKS